MEIVEVWRLEDKWGWGPFTCGAVKEATFAIDIESSPYDMPTTFNDELLTAAVAHLPKEDWRGLHFGFESLDQYKRWVLPPFREFFTTWRASKMDEGALTLNKYLVSKEHCFIGTTQVMFNKTEAVLTASYPPNYQDSANEAT